MTSFRLERLTKHTAPLAAAWINDPNINKWLDFGSGRRVLSEQAMLVMNHSGSHTIYTANSFDGQPFAITGLQFIDSIHRSIGIWYLRGENAICKDVYASSLICRALDIAFNQHHGASVNAWVVDTNHRSIRALEYAGFRRMGLQRQCHIIDGEIRNKLLYDITREEFLSLGYSSALCESSVVSMAEVTA